MTSTPPRVQLGTRLPHDYRCFLLRFNGGQPTPDEFLFKSGRDGNLVNMFLAVNHPRPMFDLVRAHANWKGRVPLDLLVIALDAGGSLVCLGVRGDRYGRVYFWSLEDEPVVDAIDGYADFYLGRHRGVAPLARARVPEGPTAPRI